jgi:DNA-binding protein Fis
MRPITGTDIINFYNSRDGILALNSAGEFIHLEAHEIAEIPSAYVHATTKEGEEVQLLLGRSTITDGDWFPDALDDDGKLAPDVAEEMASIINEDGLLLGRVEKALQTTKDWEAAAETANQLALKRAEHVAEVVAFCGGNQSKAARALGLDQSTVNKLVGKHRRDTESAA